MLGKLWSADAWKLQKLVYYCQAWSLVWEDEPLFDSRIEAWVNGPVCPELYRAHRRLYKVTAGEIEAYCPGSRGDTLSAEQAGTASAVLDLYGGKPGILAAGADPTCLAMACRIERLPPHHRTWLE
jgi:hypothetical protein